MASNSLFFGHHSWLLVWTKWNWVHWILYFLLLFFNAPSADSITPNSQDKVILQSPRVTSYGLWGHWDDCPKGSFVRAMQLKVDPDRGPKADNTALNGVRLCCSFPGYSNCVKWIKSSEGPNGNWGSIGYCGGIANTKGTERRQMAAKGIISANGFVLRQDEFQKRNTTNGLITKRYDNTASNNMELLCQDGSSVMGDGLDNGFWDWEDEKECPKSHFLCGIRTQIVPPQGSGDDAGLNNIDLKCCER